jgi:hypothetical protein
MRLSRSDVTRKKYKSRSQNQLLELGKVAIKFVLFYSNFTKVVIKCALTYLIFTDVVTNYALTYSNFTNSNLQM